MRRFAIPAVLAMSAAVFAMPAPGSAQSAISKGSLEVGGSASFTSSETETAGESAGRLTNLNIGPRVLYFLTSNLAVGGELTFGRLSNDNNSVNTYGVGPAATWYFGQGGRMWYPYVGASAQFTHTSGNDQLGNDARSLRGEGGLLFLLSDAVGVRTALFYQASHTTYDSPVTLLEVDVDTNAFGLSVGIAAFVF